MTKRWTPELVRHFTDWRSAGVSWSAIGERLGISGKYARSAMVRVGYRAEASRGHPCDGAIAELVESGFKLRRIGAELGISRETVHSRISSLYLVGPASQITREVCCETLEMAKMRTDGASLTEIAVRYGVTRQALHSRLMRLARREAVLEIREEAA